MNNGKKKKKKKKKINKFVLRVMVVVLVHVISFLFAFPIFFFEEKIEGSSIKTIWDSFFFVWTSVTTIGYRQLTASHDVSKLLIILTFIFTRASALFALIAISHGIIGRRNNHEISTDERWLIVENELKQLRSIIYNQNKLLETEVKHVRNIGRKMDKAEADKH